MSDRGIPANTAHARLRFAHLQLLNAAGERFWVKFHFRTRAGHPNLTTPRPRRSSASDRESHQRDLYGRSSAGFPEVDDVRAGDARADAAKVHYHPFDLTRYGRNWITIR